MKPCRISLEARENNPILLALGFKEVRWAVYVHPVFNNEFDFSETAPEDTLVRLASFLLKEKCDNI